MTDQNPQLEDTTMFPTADVTIAIEDGDEAIIDGVHYKKGAVAHLKAGRHEVTVPGVTKAFLDITSRCSVQTRPSLGCY